MKLTLKEIAVFGVLGTFMFISKIIMDALPNVHLIALLIIAYTIVYRQKALYPISVFIFLTGLYGGFSMWWIPYLYLWPLLWLAVMALPRFKNPAIAAPVYMVVAALHGLLYGTLYAPWQAIWMGLDFDAMLAWIAAGLPFDITHGISNFFCAVLVLPIAKALSIANKHI